MRKWTTHCHTEGENIVKLPAVHNHIPDAAKAETRKAIQLKDRATVTQQHGHQIVATVSGQVSDAVAG